MNSAKLTALKPELPYTSTLTVAMQALVLCLCTSNASLKCPDLCSFWLCWLAQPQLWEQADTAAGEAQTRQSGELLNPSCRLHLRGALPRLLLLCPAADFYENYENKILQEALGSYCWGWPAAQSQPCREGRMSQAGGLHPMPLGKPDPPAPDPQGSRAGQGTLQPPELQGWGSTSHLSWWCCTSAAQPASPQPKSLLTLQQV